MGGARSSFVRGAEAPEQAVRDMQFKYSGIGRLGGGGHGGRHESDDGRAGPWPTSSASRPTGIGLQPAATQIRRDAICFHNLILLPIIIGISLFVLALLIVVMRPLQQAVQPDAGALEPQHAGRDRLDGRCRC